MPDGVLAKVGDEMTSASSVEPAVEEQDVPIHSAQGNQLAGHCEGERLGALDGLHALQERPQCFHTRPASPSQQHTEGRVGHARGERVASTVGKPNPLKKKKASALYSTTPSARLCSPDRAGAAS